MADLPLFDFHVHGGDVRRVDEIREYIREEELGGLVLLSMPLSGISGVPGAPEAAPEAANLNRAVLESKRLLNGMTGDGGQDRDGPQVYSFGSLDNRPLLQGGEEIWEPERQVAAMAEAGFDGLKLWEGKPELAEVLHLMPDDRRLAEACREAGKLNLPVLFHIADPPEFWNSKIRVRNRQPSFDALIDAAARLCSAAPNTDFVFPHLLFLAGNLKRAGAFLEDSPNAFFDLAPGNYFYGPLSEHPDRSAAFFAEYSRRILFGTDSFFFPENFDIFPGETLEGNRRRCSRLREFLGSSRTVENPYPRASAEHRKVRGLELPDSTLSAIFAENAKRLLPEAPREVLV